MLTINKTYMLTSSGSASTPIDHRSFTACYTVTKHSWRGKYTRIFCVGPQGIATCDARSLRKLTNYWSYDSSVRSIVADGSHIGHFLLITQSNGNKAEELRFSCVSDAERVQLLTDINRYRLSFDYNYSASLPLQMYAAMKYTIQETLRPCTLRVTAIGVEQLYRVGDGPSGNIPAEAHDYEKVGEYLFCNIRGITAIADRPGSLVIAYGMEMKLHLYDVANVKLLIEAICHNAREYIGLPPFREMNVLQQAHFDSERLGIRRDALEAVEEFSVLKYSPKHRDGTVRRLLSTTTNALVERDPVTYNPLSVHFLSSIFALVRCEEDDQRFLILFKDSPFMKSYQSPLRDAILAHVLTACYSVGEGNVCVMSRPLQRRNRLSSLGTPVTEEVESLLLKGLLDSSRTGGAAPGDVASKTGSGMGASLLASLQLFNANVPRTGLTWSENRDGLFTENREKLIFNAVEAVLEHFSWMKLNSSEVSEDGTSANSSRAGGMGTDTVNQHFVAEQFQALGRLSVSRVGFSSIALVPSLFKSVGVYSVKALRMNNLAVSYAVIEFLNTLMTSFHDHYEVEHESINKNRLLKAEGFIRSLMEVLRDHIPSKSASLLVLELLFFLKFALCPPYSSTTDPAHFKRIMQDLVAILGKHLFELLSHSCDIIRYTAGQLIRVVMEEGDETLFARMQQLALWEAGLLTQFNTAVFSPNRKSRDLARSLIAYWAHSNVATQDILRRMVPLTLLSFLQSSAPAPASEQEEEERKKVCPMTAVFREAKTGWFKKSFNPRDVMLEANNSTIDKRAGVVASSVADAESSDGGRVRYRVRDVKVVPRINWNMFFYQVTRDHLRPDLIWNHTTRLELKAAVQAELEAFRQQSDMCREKMVAWNYAEFEVVYHSLDGELKVGQHYPRLLFEDTCPVIAQPREFFNDMYHRFLLVQDIDTKLECLHGLALLYKHYAETIGEFHDVPFLLQMLQDTVDPMMRDRLLLFLAHLLKARHNIKLFLDHDGLVPLMELVTLAHLHIDRPQLKTLSNSIDFIGDLVDIQGQQKEWYYAQKGIEKGPVSFPELKGLYKNGEVTETGKVWAQGMPGWCVFRTVAQLRWGVMCADLPSILTLTEVTCTVLDIFILLCEHYPSVNGEGAVIQPQPKVKRLLSSPAVLPHLVQLLLTFDSAVCSRVHTLLLSLMEANPLVGRFFLTGVFFFSCLYTASDVLPMCRLLAATHHRQSFHYPAAANDVVRTSILAPLLPPAMVCYLTHHGPEAFADVLLGEYDNPEAIWSLSMRQYMGAKVAAHIADFTPRLLSNNTVVYQYCPIVGIQYESLQKELFCSQYYLRHFCDELRFPNWPVRDPVRFLTDVLQQWRGELNKQPSSLTLEKCCEILGIQPQSSKQEMRKAYYLLAARYHPDKNPNGRDEFENIQRAYEFLATDAVESSAPSPYIISLLLKAQCILFKRCGDTLKEYKYAGYGLLLRLIENEFHTADALHKDIVLLDPATELCFFTIRNAPLNADELQEENGIHLLADIAKYCFDLITPNSLDTDSHVRIAKHCMLTFSISACFTDCRLKMLREEVIPYLTAKGIAYYQAPELSRACTEACASESYSDKMQSELVRYGCIWHLLHALFFFDASLDKAGVSLDEKHHKQLFLNHAAILALRAICSLAGIARPRAIILNSAENEGTRVSSVHRDPEETVAVAGINGTAQTTRHVGVYELLQRLLTPFILYKIEKQVDSDVEVLTLLNSNSDTPYFLWNNACRAELGELVDTNSTRFREAPFGAPDLPLLTESVAGFRYKLHASEVVVGGVFLRLFIAQPSYPIQNPVGFFMALLSFLLNKTKKVANKKENLDATEKALLTNSDPTVLQEAPLLAVQSLRLLSSNYMEPLILTASKQMASLVLLLTPFTTVEEGEIGVMEEGMQSTVHLESARTLTRFLSSDTCLEALALDGTAMTTVVLLLERVLERQEGACNTSDISSEVPEAVLALIQLMLAHRNLVQQSLDRGAYVFLLFLYATFPQEGVREECCRCLAKGYTDRLVGPQLFLRSSKYLPAAFLEMMKENPKQACRMLDVPHENPELVWSKTQKEELVNQLRESRKQIVASLSANALACWKPSDVTGESKTTVSNASEFDNGGGEGTNDRLHRLQVGGVYVGVYVQQPGWAVRHPKEFLLALLEHFVEVANNTISLPSHQSNSPGAYPDSDKLELLTKAGEILLHNAPGLRDYMTSLGYGGKIDRLLSLASVDFSMHEVVIRCSLRWMREMSRSAACVEATSRSTDVLPSLMKILEVCPSLTIGALEAMEGFLSNATRSSRVLEYAQRNHLPEIMLKYLEEGFPDSASAAAGVSAATIRAALVKVIKALITAPDEARTVWVNALLEKSPVWAKYKNQSHDLFLTETQLGGYLTASKNISLGTTTATLSLTAAETAEVNTRSEPPPL